MLFELIERNQVEVLLHFQGCSWFRVKVGGSGGSVCMARGVIHSLTKRIATIRVPDKQMRCGYHEFNVTFNSICKISCLSKLPIT